MTGLFKRNHTNSSVQPSWKAYQQHLKRNRRLSGRVQLHRGHWAVAGVLVLAIVAFWWIMSTGGNDVTVLRDTGSALAEAQPVPALIDKSDVHILLGETRLINLEENPVKVNFDGRTYQVSTSLDLELQQYLLKKMDRVNSRYIAIVAMEPSTGRLLAMAGFNKIDPGLDPCQTADYPAASLFKIVTAASAVEEKGYTAGSRFNFNGYKHTLYKRQLTDQTNRYTNSISLKDSFAQSVNPVFGKIGALVLEQQALQAYGDAFAFNREVDFELPWPISRLTVNDESYHRAEIASGFNRRTTLSPLHGALIVSAVVNDGIPVEPTLIDRIVDDAGTPVYQSQPRFLQAAVSPKTAKVLDQLMTATVTSGTAKKVFRGHTRNKVLSRLKLGGKTGSIYNRAHDARFDWFAGFATEKKGTETIVVSVMVAHEDYIGIRAGQYARMVIEQYFKDYFAKKEQTGKDSSG
ncbi:penicillin-binding transpeptidase domain-containing protein [Desulfosarcina sp.]|uniref:penicillin-binding transpeptidase domain-containing protein n=1 Tax=Desulfosarcina sp. TaxID=2027861 RepID=UPI003970DB9F